VQVSYEPRLKIVVIFQ